jgi:ubiquinone/menaquinone biosynthesis C-methylase UbiE
MKTCNLQNALKEYILNSGNPDMLAYGREVTEGDGSRFHWLIRHVMRLGRMRNARVLDLGCGFGWHSLALALVGNNRVVANDVRETMTSALTERVAAARRSGHEVDVTALCADICSLPLPAESFDAIFCNQTVEHVRDLQQMFDVCARVLKRGGRAIVIDDNNALNAKQLVDMRKMWQERDTSDKFVEGLKHYRPIENRDAKPYIKMRESIIRQAGPALTETAVQAIADASAGMLEHDIAEYAKHYQSESTLPTRPPLSWCRNPITGEYCERQLDPYELKEMMERAGFRTQVRHAFRKAPLRFLNGIQFRPLNRLLFNRRAVFVLVAEKI